MNITALFEKQYNCPISGKKILKYALCETEKDNQKNYGAQMILHTDESSEIETVENIFTDKNTAVNFIQHLYENAADIVHFKDLVYDYIVR